MTASRRSIGVLTGLYRTIVLLCVLHSANLPAPSWAQDSGKDTEPLHPKTTPAIANSQASQSKAIFQAVEKGNLQELRRLIGTGVDINSTRYDGKTPLMIAVRRGNAECVDLLLTRGAKCNLKDNEDRSAVHYAALCENGKILKAILSHGGDPNIVQREIRLPDGDVFPTFATPIYDAIAAKNIENVKTIVAAGAVINPKVNETQSTPLSCAAGFGQFDIAYFLITKGADYNAPLDKTRSIAQYIAETDLRLIGADLDEVERKKEMEKQLKWHAKVMELIMAKEKQAKTPIRDIP